MQFTRLKLDNWRNFLNVDVALQSRMFVVGANASGKSNLLDALRFLRDVADPQGGVQRAVHLRKGLSQIRSLHARRYPGVRIEVGVRSEETGDWVYALELGQDNQRRLRIKEETVRHGQTLLLSRPNSDDLADDSRLTQTHLEQVNANKPFRELQEAFAKVSYLHIVPQLIREPERSVGRIGDPYGGDFLERVARTHRLTLKSRLDKITAALRVAVPRLERIELERDPRGVPHLRGLYAHWRKGAGWQTEDQFSDGTLRLLGLLWSLLDGNSPLLLEEPELSLHEEVVRQIPSMIGRLGRRHGRQVLLSTHSLNMLSGPGIAPEEVIMLRQSNEDTEASVAKDHKDVLALLKAGMSVADAVMPHTAPRDVQQLSLFGG